MHSWVHARRNRDQSWQLFLQALYSDANDIQDGTTKEGIHLGAMAGTIDILHRCYPGMELRDDGLHLHPVLPAELASLGFSVRYRGHLVYLEFTTETVRVAVDLAEGDADHRRYQRHPRRGTTGRDDRHPARRGGRPCGPSRERMKVAVVGAGSWGTTIASVVAQHAQVTLWALEPEVVEHVNKYRENPMFLSGVRLHEGLRATTALDEALTSADAAITAVPSQYLRSVIQRAEPFIESHIPC